MLSTDGFSLGEARVACERQVIAEEDRPVSASMTDPKKPSARLHPRHEDDMKKCQPPD